MHRNYAKIFLWTLVFCFSLPLFVQADMNVNFTTKTTVKIFLCMHYKDAASGEWVTRGWWNAEPLSSKSFTLNTNNTIAYFYGNAGKRFWGGEEGKDGALRKGVVSDKFLVKDGKKPEGKNYRAVFMKRVRARDRVFNVTLTGD